MTMRLQGLVASLAALLLAAAAPAQALVWTCSSVASKKGTDPLLGEFGSKFDQPAINGAGDVAFHAKVKNGGRRLYIYPNGGGPIVIATKGDPAPNGSTFRKFDTPSINDAGDVGFLGDLSVGEGVFVREAGGTIVEAAVTGDVSPGGGTFDKILVVSHVNDDGDMSFIARVNGGPDGVFFFDKSAGTVSAVAVVGDATGDGREFCEFLKDCAVGLSDVGNSSFQASSAVSCAGGSATTGLWEETGGGFTLAAEVGGPTSIAGTTYNKLLGSPHMNAADKVLFRAKIRDADTCNNVTANVCTMDADCSGTCVGGTNVGELCTLLTDCPDQGIGTSCAPGVCGGDRCLGGADIGKPCASDAECGGASCDVPGMRGKALFLFDPAGPSTTTVVAEGDAAPGTGGGFLKTLAHPGGLTDGDQAGFRSKVKSGSTSQGGFIFNGVDEEIVLRSFPPPTDQFGLGARYRKIVEDTGVDRSGTWFTFSARVKDTQIPPRNAGLFRCEGL